MWKLLRTVRQSLTTCLVAGMLISWVGGSVSAEEGAPPKLPAAPPTLAALVPAGLTRGTSVDATLVGANLEQITSVRVTGEGVTAELVPLANGKKPNPRQTTVKVTASLDAAPGMRELRIVTAGGASNVARFVVGTLPEFLEKEPNDVSAAAHSLESLPIVANGTLDRGEDRDCYRFAARAGQTIVLDLCGQALHPYVANQRPGWLEGFLSVREAPAAESADESPSRILAYSYDFPGRDDPLLVFVPPRDGMYVVEVRDDLYRGRAEFNYRLTIGEVPYITAVFPAGGPRGQSVPVALEGFNLRDVKSVSLPIAADSPLGPRFERTNLEHANSFRWEVGDAVELVEAEPNDTADQAQRVASSEALLGIVMNGVIDRDGEADVYRVTASKGQRLLCETSSRAFGSPLDARLELLDSQGRRLKESDDTNTAFDAQIDHVFAADGEYLVRVTDTTGIGSRRHVYRLSIRPPRPDFALTVSPDNARVTAGATVPLKVRVQRRDGFTGDVELGIEGAPEKAVVGPAIVPNGVTEYLLTLTIPSETSVGVLPLTVVGKSKIGDSDVTRRATSAEAIRYVNDLRYVPVNDLVVSVLPPAPVSIVWGSSEATLVAGDTIMVPVRVERAPGFTAPVKLLIDGLPPRVVSPPVTIEENATEAMVELRSNKSTPALETTVVVAGTVTQDGVTLTQHSSPFRLKVTTPAKP